MIINFIYYSSSTPLFKSWFKVSRVSISKDITPLSEFKFLCNIDSITDASEVTQDGERFIRSTFNILTKAYLLPEYLNSIVTNKVSNMKKQLTPSKIVFSFESDATNKQVEK